MEDLWDIVVVGGGAAGIFAAAAAAERLNRELRILVLEKGSSLLSKVKVSGGGRCNVTHACFDPAQLVQYYPRGSQELRGAFQRFQPADTVHWFESRGIPLKTEPDGRMFPLSNTSQTIVDCLLDTARQAGVELRTQVPVERVEWGASQELFEVFLRSGEALQTRKLLLATGGERGGLALAESLGHTLQPPVPSLFTFKLSDPRLDGLAGVSVERAGLRLVESGLEQTGPLVVTHWGISGPAVLKLSAWGARRLHEAGYRSELSINWLPKLAAEQVHQALIAARGNSSRSKVSARVPRALEAAEGWLPQRLWQRLIQSAGLLSDPTWGEVSNAAIGRLVEELCRGTYRIEGKGEFKEEFVTCGGVTLKEIQFKTMQSRVCPGLYLAGEILDIDGITGGFNFQSAWTTGWLAGRAMASEG